MKIRLIRQVDNQFSLDLAQADIQSNPSPANVAGDTYSVKLPGIPPAAAVPLTGGNVVPTLGSTILQIVCPVASAALVNAAVGQNIDVVLTRSSKTYAFEYHGDLDVKDQSNQ